MNNNLDGFEKSVKKSLLGYEAPYDPSDWDALEKKLDARGGGGVSTGGVVKKILWAAAGVAVISAAVWFGSGSDIATTDRPDVEPLTTQEQVEREAAERAVSAPKPSKVAEKPSEPGLSEEGETVESAAVQPNTINSETNKNALTGKTEEPVQKQAVRQENALDGTKAGQPGPVENQKIDTKFVLPGIIAEKTVYCAGDTVRLAVEKDMDVPVLWDMGNGEFCSGDRVVYVYDTPGMYTVRMVVDGNRDIVSEAVELKVNPVPDASFTSKKELEEEVIPVVIFRADFEGGKAYLWSFGDGYMQQGQQVSHSFKRAGQFVVTLRVINKYGCSATATATIINDRPYNLLAPNSFSPNGDGLNDTWLPKALETGVYQFTLRIYDRQNRLVYETTDPELPWDGKVNGTMSNPGDVFIWRANVRKPSGETEQFMGSIIIM